MTGIFIIARLGSTRLEKKHLIKAAGKTFIEWLATRYAFAFSNEIKNNEVAVYIVTSENEENKKFESVFGNYPNIQVFYGSDSNIPLRQLQCALANNIDNIISIDGDDILCSTNAALLIRNHLLDGKEFVKTSGLPLGMNVMGYRKDFLAAALKSLPDPNLETGWGRIFNYDYAENISLGNYDLDVRLRLTLDYEEDAEFFSQIINNWKERIIQLDDASLIGYILGKGLYLINQGVNDEYWQNFNQQKKAESKYEK